MITPNEPHAPSGVDGIDAEMAADIAELEAWEAALQAESGAPASPSNPVQAPPGGWLPRPACGHQMFSEWWCDDICDVCFWQDDLFQLRYPWSQVGANGGVSLIEAQTNFRRFGAVREDLVRYVQPPADDEPLDPGWRPLDPDRDSFERECGSGVPYPDDLTELYWWRPTYWRRHEKPAAP
ncbi:CPCC family cysteine-rich protein [Streptomyces sp. NPDC020719]|uniref:CPCC family cysteine-rich protein n=1 Tax=Streptomyces sp. NPDC020719 TaxID=3154896 RepID=UPI0033DDB208